MRKVSLLILVGFFFLNPGVACGPQEPEYQYGAAEMRAAVEGDWALTVTPTGGTAIEYVVSLEQATSAATAAARPAKRAVVRTAHACGDRMLVASANACFSTSSMPLAVTLVSGEPPASGSPTGSFSVLGLTFLRGNLYLTIGSYHVQAELEADGTVLNASLAPGGSGDPTGAATIRRLP